MYSRDMCHHLRRRTGARFSLPKKASISGLETLPPALRSKIDPQHHLPRPRRAHLRLVRIDTAEALRQGARGGIVERRQLGVGSGRIRNHGAVEDIEKLRAEVD